jgi:hypothetical protein
MALTEQEQAFVQNQSAPDFKSYLKLVWNTWPALRYMHARRKASKLWKARKQWLKSLEPTPIRLQRNCPTCSSSFHEIWSPSSVVHTPPSTSLTVTQWNTGPHWDIEAQLEEPSGYYAVSSCWGCREDQPNQLAHMDPGGCLHEEEYSIVDGYDYLPSNLPLLPASPASTH